MRMLPALLLSAALALPVANAALAQGAPSPLPPMITVTGEGVVDVAPDMATLSLGVTTQADTAAEALAANSTSLDRVLANLAAAGIEPRDIQTSNLSLNPNWTGYDSTPRITGYVAANIVTVRIRALDRLGVVLDTVVADGANTLNGLTFGLADPEPALNDARREAVLAARAKAELLAEAAGVTLGRIVSISEAALPSFPQPMFRTNDAAMSVPVAGGELGMSASVTVFYEINQ